MKKQIKRFRVRTVAAMVALAFVANAWAVDPFTVRDIRVEGLQRVEPGTVFASLPFRIGDQYNDEKGSAAIRALFGLGLFKDVRLEVSGDVLVVIVEERPTVADVDFVGTKEFDKDVLKKALREIGLTEGRPYDQGLADRAEQELKRQYINKSLYGAEVVTTVTPIERNRVNLTFTVTEGEPARIKEIRIVGNKAFSESTLRGLFDLDTGGCLSWYTKSDRYSRAKLNADLEALRSYYLSRGYLEFRIDSTQVAISPNKQDITITVNVTEGERYVVSGVKLEGNYLGKEEEFKSLVTIRPGQPYNADQVAETTKAFTDYFGKFGYAFANVEARPEIDRANNRVEFVLAAEPSRRAYVRRVNISGNNRTRDEVIRREFRQFESSWYDADKIKLSRDRIDRLGYFKEVNVETSEVPGAPDQVDLNLTVVEKPTGSLQLGAGLLQRRKAGAVVLDQAGKRLRHRQLPGRRSQHQQVQPDAGLQLGQPVLHARRRFAHHRPLPPRVEAVRGPGRQLRAGHHRRRPALRRSFQRTRHRLFRRQPGAHRDQARHQHPGGLSGVCATVRLHQHRHAADASAGRATIATARSLRPRAAISGPRASWAWSATRATCGATTSSSSTFR